MKLVSIVGLLVWEQVGCEAWIQHIMYVLLTFIVIT